MTPRNKDKQDEISETRILRSNAQSPRKSQQEQNGQAETVNHPEGSSKLPAQSIPEEDDEDDEQETFGYTDHPIRHGKPRGRPKSRAATLSHFQLTMRTSQIPSLLPTPSLPSESEKSLSIASISNADAYDRPSSSPSKRPASPTKKTSASHKKGDKALEESKADASLCATDLASCSPAIFVQDSGMLLELPQINGELPGPVKTILKYLQINKDSYLPISLKVSPAFRLPRPQYAELLFTILQSQYQQEFDTPNKIKGDLSDHNFQSTFASTHEQATFLKKTVNFVMINASRNQKRKAPERQWGSTVVGPLINAVLESCSGIYLLNMYAPNALSLATYRCCSQITDHGPSESSSIQPVDVRPTREDGKLIDDIDVGDVQSKTPSTTSGATANDPTPTSRMVDYSLGLWLTSEEEVIIAKTFNKIPVNARSLNQSLSYCNNAPLLMDLELKKTNSDRDPVTQLAVWQGAGFKKRVMHGWDMESMPMLGVVVTGHMWEWYVTFQIGIDDLVS